MSEQLGKTFVPAELPECMCFDFEDNAEWATGRCAAASQVSAAAAHGLFQMSQESNFCPDALPYLVDLMIITLAVHMATAGTIIEQGTEDAEREVDRVLTGLEARVKMRSREMHAFARSKGLTVKTLREMRERNGGGAIENN